MGGWSIIRVYVPTVAGADGVGMDTLIETGRLFPQPEIIVRKNNNVDVAKYYVVDIKKESTNLVDFYVAQHPLLITSFSPKFIWENQKKKNTSALHVKK